MGPLKFAAHEQVTLQAELHPQQGTLIAALTAQGLGPVVGLAHLVGAIAMQRNALARLQQQQAKLNPVARQSGRQRRHLHQGGVQMVAGFHLC